jgi:predicted outer membrane protein
MQPQQTPQLPNNNFDFIMNPAQAPHKSPFGGGSSMATRALVVVGGLFLLIIIIAVAVNVFAKSGASFDKSAVLSVAQDQTEIIRLSTIGVQNSVSQNNKNFSVTTQLGMATEQQNLLAYLATKGYKPNPKSLLLKQSSKTTTLLESATSSSTFDVAYTGVMQQELQAYKQDLTKAYNSAGDSAKPVLKANYTTADLLLTQLTGTTSN